MYSINIYVYSKFCVYIYTDTYIVCIYIDIIIDHILIMFLSTVPFTFPKIQGTVAPPNQKQPSQRYSIQDSQGPP